MQNKKILFIEAPYTYAAAGSEVVGKYYPLGIGYLAAYIRQFGYEVKVFEPSSDESYFDELKKLYGSYEPALVGISVMTPSYPGAVEICNLLKSINREVITVLGGHHVSAVGGDVMEQAENVDYSIIGEGEVTLHELIGMLESDSPEFKDVGGLAWRDGEGNVIVNEPRELIKDIDSIPFPARDIINMDNFRMHSYIDFGKKSATMITSRGCPYKCMFCSSWLTMGARYRFRSVENVIAEIKEMVANGIDHLVFEDDTATLKKSRIMAICDELIKMPNRPSWYCLSRVDAMDYELAKKMKEAGCRMVNFGIESGSPEILKKIGKKISHEKAIEAISACKKAGLRTQCSFIVGFPFDTEQTLEMTYSMAVKINPTIAIFFPLTPYPGTKMFDEYFDKSLIPHTIDEWKKYIVTDNTSGISVNSKFNGEEIKKMANKFNQRFFLRPSHWPSMLKTVSNFSDFTRLFRGALYLVKNFFKEMGSNKRADQ